jgi:hypothetical protein
MVDLSIGAALSSRSIALVIVKPPSARRGGSDPFRHNPLAY